MASASEAAICSIHARAYRIPAPETESDGTLEWDATTLITVHVRAGAVEGIGYSYAGRGCLAVVEDTLVPQLTGCSVLDIPMCWQRMNTAVRNLGRSGEVACAVAAVDNALWDAKAKWLEVPFIHLLGAARDAVPVYGSGGFTGMGAASLLRQLDDWRRQGISRFKIKIGRDRQEDMHRVGTMAKALQKHERLFVDANGAYHPKQALETAQWLHDWGVTWFEEPVSSDDVEGLRLLRRQSPAGMDIVAGEYGYTPDDFQHLLMSGAVDVLQADATRCLGVSGWLKAAALTEICHRPLSSHCAPLLHVPLMCHAQAARHMEYFADHVRIERELFDGMPDVTDGMLGVQTEIPGFGYAFRKKDAERYAL